METLCQEMRLAGYCQSQLERKVELYAYKYSITVEMQHQLKKELAQVAKNVEDCSQQLLQKQESDAFVALLTELLNKKPFGSTWVLRKDP